MKPMDTETEISKMENGSDDLVKPLQAVLVAPLPMLDTRHCRGPPCIHPRHGRYWLVLLDAPRVHRFTVDGSKDDLPLPVASLPAAQLDIVKDNAKLFWDEIRAGVTPDQDLVITEAHLNGLIASSDYLCGHVTLSEDQWYVELALPADKLPGGKGRYFVGNGVAVTKATDPQATHLVTELTPKHAIKGLDFATILSGQYLAHRSSDEG